MIARGGGWRERDVHRDVYTAYCYTYTQTDMEGQPPQGDATGAEEDKARSLVVVSEGASLGRVLREVEATVASCASAAASHMQRIQGLEHELSSLRFQVSLICVLICVLVLRVSGCVLMCHTSTHANFPASTSRRVLMCVLICVMQAPGKHCSKTRQQR